MENSDAFRQKFGQVITELANVGDFLMEHGFYERAANVFLTLSKGDPTFEAGSYAYDLGICYEHLKQHSKAKEYFEIAARENPHMPEYKEAAMRYRSVSSARGK
jgi:tetratricopeptide (TPR) repeat protein